MLSLPQAQAQSLVGELRSHKEPGMAKEGGKIFLVHGLNKTKEWLDFTDEKTKMLGREIIPLIQKIKIQTQVCLILDSIIILIR